MDHDQGEVSGMDHPAGLEQKIKGTPHKAQEPDQSNKQMNQSEDEVDYINHHEGLDKNFNNASKDEALKHDQSKKEIKQSKGEIGYVDQPKGIVQKFTGAPHNEALELDEFKKRMYQFDDDVDNIDHPEDHDKKFKDTPKYKALEPDQSKKQGNQLQDENKYMDQPEISDKKFKASSQHEVPKHDQSKKQMNQSEHNDISKSTIKIEDDKGKQSQQPIEKVVPPGSPNVASEVEDKTNDSGNNKKSEDSPSQLSKTSQDQGKGEIAPKKKHFWSNWPIIGDASKVSIAEQPKANSSKQSDLTTASQAIIPKQLETEIDLHGEKKQEHIEVKVDEVDTGVVEEVVPAESTPLAEEVVTTIQTLEILKSVVYGGLIESLASLSVVTSAASADATTLNIVALAIANLMGGLFVLGHNFEELKSEQVDRYNELLGQRKNFIIHALIAILSFIVFGLVPPVAYGFSFRESDDKDFKVAAVAGASLLCITLLSIAKAYIKRPNSYLTYFKTVLYYVSTGAVASVLSYLAGDLVKKLIAKFGWLESSSNFALEICGIGVQQPRWGSY